MVGLREITRAYPEVLFYGISRDTTQESGDFARKVAADGRGALGTSLLSDVHSATIDRYGLRDPAYAGEKIDGVPLPSVFVLDAQGRIRSVKVETDYRVRPTNEDVAAALDALQ